MNVLVLPPFNAAQKTVLEAGAPGATFVYSDYRSATDEQIAAADVIVGNLSPKRLCRAARLQLLQLNSAGYDNYAAAETLPRGARVCCAVGAYGQAVSEHIFAMVLAMIKRLPAYHADQLSHTWSDHGPVTSLRGARVLVMGTGDIGTHFAQLCRAMGANVTGIRRSAVDARPPFERMVTMDQLYSELPRADVVASFLPSDATTRGLADKRFFSSMPAGSFFANGGRGDLVVADDLIEALSCGHIAGAALDVTAPEPLPADHPLWDAPGALITPHISGNFHLPVVLDNIAAIAAENLAHLAAGEPLRNHVL